MYCLVIVLFFFQLVISGANECSPVSNDSHIASPEPEEKIASPPREAITPPLRRVKDYLSTPRESPHTPPLLPLKSANHNSMEEFYQHKVRGHRQVIVLN